MDADFLRKLIRDIQEVKYPEAETDSGRLSPPPPPLPHPPHHPDLHPISRAIQT